MTSSGATSFAQYLDDPRIAWSLGSFGAIAEFMWSEADEPARGHCNGLSRCTSHGAIRIDPPAVAVFHEYITPSRFREKRRREIAVCLPMEECGMGQRCAVTELGPDHMALREQDRGAILFDVGLDQLNVDAHVRTSNPETLEMFRSAVGRSIFDPTLPLLKELPRLSPHRVFESRCGRIEVYQPIPPIDGRSPDGPHTHVLPKLLATKRTHAANLPIPKGFVPCLTLHFSRPDPEHAMEILHELADNTL